MFSEWLSPNFKWDLDSYDPRNGKNSFEWSSLLEGFPEYDPSKLEGDSNPLDFLYYYQYLFNIGTISIPMTVIASACVGYNMWVNVDWNQGWAEGNAWLLFNTAYLMMNWAVVLPELFEMPFFMHAFHVSRMLITSAAAVYDFGYVVSLIEWLNQLYWVGDKSDYDFFTVYINMLLGYNIAMNWP
jgi:hypothetical protein